MIVVAHPIIYHKQSPLLTYSFYEFHISSGLTRKHVLTATTRQGVKTSLGIGIFHYLQYCQNETIAKLM